MTEKHINNYLDDKVSVAVPQMQRMLNSDKKKEIEILKQFYPVNNTFYEICITEIKERFRYGQES